MSNALKTSEHPMSIENSQGNETKPDILIKNPEEEKVTSTVFEKFRAAADNRNRSFAYFDNRNLIEYINDSVGRYYTNIDERDGIEDWQSRLNVPLTHTKVIAVLGRVVSQLPVAEVNPRFDDDTKRASLLSSLYEYSEDADDYEELMICAALEAIIKGTVVGFEGYENKTSVKRHITGYSEDGTPKFKEETVTEAKLYGSIVPLEQFYPSSVSIRRIEDMPYAFRRYVIPYSSFVDEFSCYPRYTMVEGKQSPENDGAVDDVPFYRDYISMDVEDGNVEIIAYYNKSTDEYVLMANGIWLNPLKDFSVAPNPYNHKKLPFWSVRFDTLGPDFFYGKSLVDRLSGLQDVMNVLTNMALDQSFLTIFPPILTAGIDPIEEDYLRPGRRVPVDTQGMPLSEAFMKLDMGVPSGWHQWIMQYTQSILSESSVDKVTSGSAGVGGRTTAEEIRMAASGVAAVLGVFGKLINYGIKNKAYLRCANILQFWTDSRTPVLSSVLGEKTGVFQEAFNLLSVDNSRLSQGKRGKRIIAMYPNAENLPTRPALKTKSMLYSKQTGKTVEIEAITGEYLRNLKYDIRLVPNMKSNDTKEIQKALILEKARVYMSFFPQTVNMSELQSQLAEVFGDDAERMFIEAPEGQPTDGGDQRAQTEPQGDVANNMMRQMMGGEQDSMQFRDMANQ